MEIFDLDQHVIVPPNNVGTSAGKAADTVC